MDSTLLNKRAKFGAKIFMSNHTLGVGSFFKAAPCIYTQCLKKTVPVFFLNNSVKHWPALIIFGMQHREETRHKRLQFCSPHLNTVATLPCEMQKT